MAAIASRARTQPITDSTQSTQIVRGTIALTGNYGGGATHGDTLDLSGYPAASGKTPLAVYIYEQPAAGTAPSGYSFLYANGTNAKNGQIVVLQNAAALGPASEYPQGTAYSAALLAAALHFEAVFPLGQ